MADGWQKDEPVAIKVYIYIYLYTNKARCVTGRLTGSHINRQRLEGRGRDSNGQMHSAVCAAMSVCRSMFTFIYRWNGFMINGDGDVCFALSAGRVKNYLFKICNGGRWTGAILHGVIVGWRDVACVG